MYSKKMVLAAILLSTPLVLHGYQVDLGNTHQQQTTPLGVSKHALSTEVKNAIPRRFELLQPRTRTATAEPPAQPLLLRPRPVVQPTRTPTVLRF